MSATMQPAMDNRLAETPAYLGVESSLGGFRWRERLPAEQAPQALMIAQQHQLPEILGRVLAARGVTAAEVPDYLNPSLKSLMPDPLSLQDMATGAERIARAIKSGEQVAIFGDYDVDGAASAALMHRYFAAHSQQARIYIPDRIFEGYGPNADAIRRLIADGATLIITVDCGISSHQALAAAEGTGCDVVVIDHHQAAETLPPATAVINPNRLDDLSGQGHLAAAGVVFLVLAAVTRELRQQNFYGNGRAEPHLLAWLDLVALATVCDIVPLQGLNRAYVTKGLAAMRLRQNAGLAALADSAGLEQAPAPYHLGYILGPRINAGGRIGDAALGARLLSTDSAEEAAQIAATLEKLNRERRAMEAAMLEEATAQAERDMAAAAEDMPLLITGSPDWHKGLVGLMASRLTEKFRRPSLVIAWEGTGAADQGTGSLRSIAGVDIGAAVRAAVDAGLLVKGGGHAMAAGLTLVRDRLDTLADFLQTQLAAQYGAARSLAELKIDGSLSASGANLELLDQLERAGPYGSGNPAPRFVFPAHHISFAKVVGDGHVRCTLTAGDNARLNGIAFRAADTPLAQALLDNTARPVHVAGKLKRNFWQGRESVDLTIEDAAFASDRP